MPAGVELRERGVVQLAALGLAHDRPVPVQAERGEVGELLLGDAGPHAPAVEVVDAQEEARALRAGEQPGQQRGAQVAEVQRPRRRRGVAAGGVRAGRRDQRARALGRGRAPASSPIGATLDHRVLAGADLDDDAARRRSSSLTRRPAISRSTSDDAGGAQEAVEVGAVHVEHVELELLDPRGRRGRAGRGVQHDGGEVVGDAVGVRDDAVEDGLRRRLGPKLVEPCGEPLGAERDAVDARLEQAVGVDHHRRALGHRQHGLALAGREADADRRRRGDRDRAMAGGADDDRRRMAGARVRQRALDRDRGWRR